MPYPSLNRRHVLQAAGAAAVATAVGPVLRGGTAGAAIPPVRPDLGVAAYAFDMGQVRLTASRWLDNQNRTLNYLRFVPHRV